MPDSWDDQSKAAYFAEFDRTRAERGMAHLQALLSRRQYQHDTGIFFGGRSETGSNKTFRKIVENHVKGATDAAFIDFHSGLWPYGHVELIHSYAPDSEKGKRL